ncbi:hypothetical protein EVG20_g6018 [Dentipellis fragilis]|uniref:F-box domain-containing protein n=1 Tax=Dentipellis fragilis TaxID=205917 RepID=A0A4Y9YT18_9AGAM|nr:hypothetical protein EVG20_g6018 [Dentipellis fragilis]
MRPITAAIDWDLFWSLTFADPGGRSPLEPQLCGVRYATPITSPFSQNACSHPLKCNYCDRSVLPSHGRFLYHHVHLAKLFFFPSTLSVLGKLTVDVCHRDLDKFIRMGLMQPAPILESLIIKDLEYRDKIARALPSNMFSGFTPRLQRLHIHALRLPWLLPDLGGLTELVVDITFRGLLWHKRTYVPVDGGPLTTESVFYDALRKMTNLRRLVLLTCLPPLSKASTSEVRGIVEMPHLQLMKVGGEAISCGHVIGFVKRPATCQLHVHCILSQTANIHDIDFLLQLLGSYSQLTTYAVDVHSLKKSSMRFSLVESYDDEHHVTVVSDSWDHLDQVYIDVSCRGEDAAPQGWCSIAVISKLFGAIPSAHVRSLAFRYIPGPGVSYSGWWHTVKLFPNLKHLHLSDRLATIFFIMAWSPEMSRRWARLAESTTDAEDVHILPELVSLKFWGRLNESIAGTALKDALFKALVGRKNAGLPLRKLFLGGGREDADWVEACKELVTVSLKD